MPLRRSAETRAVDRQIVGLAVPAFLALVAEPLFLLADAAVVGHLGTTELAGLGIASVVIRVVVGLCVFLAYGTTAAVARQVGAGRRRGGPHPGGRRAVARRPHRGRRSPSLGLAAHRPADRALRRRARGRRRGDDVPPARLARGCSPMLLMLAATGVLRGLHDTRTPLYVAVVGQPGQHRAQRPPRLRARPRHRGLRARDRPRPAGRGGRAGRPWWSARPAGEGASLRPDLPGVRRSARAGGPLLVRTLSLQACLVAMTWCAAGLGATATATHQLAMTVWTFLAYALDAVAIAAQTITGTALGAGDLAGTRRATDRMIQIGLVSGVVTGVLLALTAPVLGPLFTDDPEVVVAAGPGAARRRGVPARRRGRLRARRGADRRRRRPLPGRRRASS